MTLDHDDVDLLMEGCRPFGTIRMTGYVEGFVWQEDFGVGVDSFVEWRRRRARTRLFRSWLDVTDSGSRSREPHGPARS